MEPQKSNILPVILAILITAGIVGGSIYWYEENKTTSTPQPTASVSVSPTASSATSPVATIAPPSTTSAPQLDDLIKVTSPVENASVNSPLSITGSARGSWYSEAVFPIILLDGTGKEIAHTQGQAQGEWMTDNYVPFTATLTFTKPATPTGTLVLKKDNPSGLPANDKSLSIAVRF